MKYIYYVFLFLLSNMMYGQTPGGVTEPEVWFKATSNELAQDIFLDFSKEQPNPKRITSCNSFDEGLFNFNPSLAGKFCLKYRGILEGVKEQNLFFVSEPSDTQENYRHVETDYFSPNSMSEPIDFGYLDSISQNIIALDSKQGYASRQGAVFAQNQLANVHFYNWHNYDQNKLFKSFGIHGESEYKVGRASNLEQLFDSQDFEGILPEFIVFNRDLNDNERNRVESYLALKYGITLNRHRNYKNSQNKIFWNKKNNKFFLNNIFGMGRDDISTLNQLQSESVHHRNYLIMGIDVIKETNEGLQQITSLKNNEFLVSGNTGASGIASTNEQGLRFLKKVWLAQVTGKDITQHSIEIKFDIRQEFNAFLEEIMQEKLFVYMVQDPFVNQNYVSDFDNGNIIYTKATKLEPEDEQIYAYFEKVFFD